jgi:hypothetical protein
MVDWGKNGNLSLLQKSLNFSILGNFEKYFILNSNFNLTQPNAFRSFLSDKPTQALKIQNFSHLRNNVKI